MIKKIVVLFILLIISTVVFAQGVSEKDFFLIAKNTYEEGAYSMAVDLFNKFIKDFPNSQAISEAKLYIAQCLFEDNKFIEARDILVELEKTIIPYGIEDKILFWLGKVYLKVRDLKEAEEYFRKLINKHPKSALSIETQMQLGLVLYEDGKYSEARDVFDNLSKSDDIDIKEEALFKKGEILYNMQDYKAVLENYRAFSNIFLDSDKLPKAYFYMGQASFYLEDLKKAEEYYFYSLEKSSDDSVKAMSLQGLGWAYLKEDKLREAQGKFLEIEKFEEEDFNKENILFGQALIHYKLSEFDKAISYYEKLINTYPGGDMIWEALFGKAQCLAELFRLSEAVNIYKEIINKPINNSGKKEFIEKSHYNLGLIYLELSDANLALPEFQYVISQSNDKEIKLSALQQAADIFQEAKEFKKAIEPYRQILKDYPAYPHNDYIQYQLGFCLFMLDDLSSAISVFKDFNKNFTHSDFLDDVNYYLCFSYFKQKDFEISCRQFQNFLEAFKDSIYTDKASYMLAVSFSNRGLFKEAISVFENVLKEFNSNKDLIEDVEYEIANAYYQDGQKELAARKFQRFIDNYPKSEIAPSVLFWLGEYYRQGSEFELSKKSLESLIRMYPGHQLISEAWYGLSLVYLSEHKLDNALQNFRKLSEESNMEEIKFKAMLAIGDLLAGQEKDLEAADAYNNLINSTLGKDGNISGFVNKFVRLAYIRLGDLYKKNNNFTLAVDAYKKAIQIAAGESNAQIQFSIAECFEEQHNLDISAQEYLKITYVCEQDTTWVVKGLLRSARIYENRQDWEDAIQTYEKIINYNTPEVKYAKNKIDEIKKQIKFN